MVQAVRIVTGDIGMYFDLEHDVHLSFSYFEGR